MRETDKSKASNDQRKSPSDPEERKIRALEQIAVTLTKMLHELIQLRVQAANVNVSLARKR
jgi:hypothetical protein